MMTKLLVTKNSYPHGLRIHGLKVKTETGEHIATIKKAKYEWENPSYVTKWKVGKWSDSRERLVRTLMIRNCPSNA